MSNVHVVELADCTEFRQTMQAHPPRSVHGSVLLLIALILMAILWSHLTTADIVVRAAGRVRPMSTPVKIISGARAEVLSGSHGARVVEVGHREGDQVQKGDVLIRLDTSRLDNDIEALRRRIAAGEEEITRLDKLGDLLSLEFAASHQKARAELAEARAEIETAQERRSAEMRLAAEELSHVERDAAVQEELASRRAASESELAKARQEVARARAKLEMVRLPVNKGHLMVLQEAVELASRQYEVKREELASKRAARLAEVEAARIELRNMELERDHSTLRAPMDGIIISGDVKPGDFLDSDQIAMEIAETRGFLFEALVPSEEVAHVRPGMNARIKLDAYDYQRYGSVKGNVAFVAPDSEVLEENYVHAYLVRIVIPSDELARSEFQGRLKLGMAGQTEIVTEQRSVLSLLINKVKRSISLG